MSSAEASQRGVVSGLLNLSRNLGLITGTSVMAAVYAMVSGARGPAVVSAGAATAGAHAAFASAGVLIVIALLLALRQLRAPLISIH
ncbi:hypothetical protein [Tahibacter sp.]|uniref:hypothetical protein n=1 Tax=Tahibacter sp. TaxID=2056211 RepID=UPI0028C46167|nr:hypothetical protein [Tahibacter sp.]